MSVTPGPYASPLVDPERPFGGGPRIEDGVHVADQEDARTGPRAVPRTVPTIVGPRRPSGSG